MSNGSEALFYARMLSPELVLGLACEASSPLSRVRHQAASLIHRLVEPLPSPVTVIPPEPPPSAAAADDEEALGADVQGELPDFNLAELLASMPSPDPEPLGVPDSGEWLPEETPDVQPPPATPSNGDEVTYALPWETGWDEETAKTVEINLPPNLAETVRLPGVAITRPINTDLSAGPVSSVTAGVTRPVFTCILLPARPEHYLTGEVAQWLAVTVPQMCHAFGWQIEGLTIQPSYLQWSVRLPPAVSPSYLVRLIRKQTSLALLQRFAVSGRSATDDFWAPGYLIISGADPIAPNMLRDFIAQTRRRQGLKIA
jgi:REP element-mobilizing transposase RayT